MTRWEDEEFHKKWNFALWRRLGVFAKPYRGSFVLLGLTMMAVGCIDAVFPLLTKTAVDRFMRPGPAQGNRLSVQTGYYRKVSLAIRDSGRPPT